MPHCTTPYYDHAGITIYHGDCLEVLQALDIQAQLIVTDPPYGVQWQSRKRKNLFGVLEGDQNQSCGNSVLPLAFENLQRGRHAYVFGRWDCIENNPHLKSCEIIWDKGMMGGGDISIPWGPQHEYIQFVVNNKQRAGGAAVVKMRRGSVLKYQRQNSGEVRHPTEKPVRLLRELIEASSLIGETVLDPFLGSGSTAEACRIEERRCIGIEIEERYCEIAAKRLRQEMLQFT